MALVDFHLLTHLYKLQSTDDAFLHNSPSHLQMSPAPSTPGKLHGSSLPASVQPYDPSTPGRRVPYRGQTSTPFCRGTSVRTKQEPDSDRNEGYKREDYDDYILEDLNKRVFVDFEVLLKSVLHVPPDWRSRWKSAIRAVKRNRKFKEYHGLYCQFCDEGGTVEESFYEPLVGIANTVLGVVFQSGRLDGASGNPQRYHVNNPGTLRGGVMNKRNLSPDLVVTHEDCQVTDGQPLHWANALQILEVKPYDTALSNGEKMAKLKVDGEHMDRLLRFSATYTGPRGRSS